MRTINFAPEAFAQYNEWRNENRKMQDKIADLIEDALKNPFAGLGKTEPLKYRYKGFWSRRIDEEHRLIYQVERRMFLSFPAKGITAANLKKGNGRVDL